MKKFYFLLIALSFMTAANAQVITFPDANFKAKLLEASPSNQIAKDLSDNWIKIDANNNGEIEVAEVISLKELRVYNANIANLSGIANFQNLETLICGGNQLTSIDLNGLTNLRVLACDSNQLTSLNLSNLVNLTQLACDENQLTSLNLSGLINLSRLYCENNQLVSLDLTGLTNLADLLCRHNQLTSLNLSGLSNLTQVYCSNNQLTSLNLTGVTNLSIFECNHNQLTSLDLTGFTDLYLFSCDFNQLTSLNFVNMPLLESVSCNNNLLESLNFSGSTLLGLSCANNQLTALDLNGITNMPFLHFYCGGNPLEYIFVKNGIDETGINPQTEPVFDFQQLPNLRYICADDFQVEAIQNKINQYGYTNCTVNSYCSFTPGGEYYTIQGSSKVDNDNNGCDASDLAFPNLSFTISDGTNNGTFISNSVGSFSMPVQAGSHTVTPYFENPTYFTISPANVNVTFPTQTSPFTQDFCVTANGEHPDLEVMLVPIMPARPGFDAVYKLVYKNKGTNTQFGTINLVFDDAVLDFVSSAPTATTQAIGNLTWDFTNLQPFETREITLTLNVNSPMEIPAVNGGDVLNYTATITSAAIDENINDNTFTLNQTVVNSYDPNDKTCLEGATIAPSEVGKYVHYMIRFENTGTFPAQNIVVKDMIDTNKYDINSLVPIKGSHSFVTNITSGNKVEFIFENINLPFDDANNDGYVAFKIKTLPSLVNGDTFSNSASIYFDYNFPIVTNTAVTTIQALSNQDFSFGNYFMLYPNPVKDVLNIETKQTIEVSSISIYNQLGQLVLVVPSAHDVSRVDISSLAAGNYFIKINSDKGTSNTRFIKQ